MKEKTRTQFKQNKSSPIRFISSMCSQMKLQFFLARQRFAAYITNSEIASMGVHVKFQTVPMLIHLGADDTYITARTAHQILMHGNFMSMEISGVQKGLVAIQAVERFEPSVVIVVLLKML